MRGGAIALDRGAASSFLRVDAIEFEGFLSCIAPDLVT